MKRMSVLITLLATTPAFAAKGPFFSLGNTDFVVTIGFLVFLGVLVYFKVPGMLMGLLDQRAAGIQSDLDEARALREEAQSILAEYERKAAETKDQAEAIVKAAREEAAAAAEQAKVDLATSVTRRLAAAQDQIASAEASAVKEVRDTAVTVAIAVAGEVVAKQLKAADANAMIADSIKSVGAKLH